MCSSSCVKAFVVKTNPLENNIGIRRIDACTCVVAIARRMASATATGLWSRVIVRRGAHGSAWWPISVRWMRQGVWAFINKPQALPLLQALLDGNVQTVGEEQVLLVNADVATDLLTSKTVTPLPANLEDIVVNNRVRRELGTAIATLKLISPDRSTRLTAARELQNGADEATLPAISKALTLETDPEIKELLVLTQASIQLSSRDRATRIAAIRALAAATTGDKPCATRCRPPSC